MCVAADSLILMWCQSVNDKLDKSKLKQQALVGGGRRGYSSLIWDLEGGGVEAWKGVEGLALLKSLHVLCLHIVSREEWTRVSGRDGGERRAWGMFF